jgi:ESS family glutamate:Na+ symporter
VLGGLLVAVVMLVAQEQGVTLVTFNTTLQSPLMIAFFTTIGFGASVSMLKVGGPLVIRFLVVATVFAILQNVLGGGLAALMGLDPLFGVMVGSVTLTGGPATGLAFAPQFEEAGVPGAASIAVAAAMGGIVFGGIIGGPICTWLIRRHALGSPRTERRPTAASAKQAQRAIRAASIARDDLSELVAETTDSRIPPDDDPEHTTIGPLKNLVVILVAMWLGAWVSNGFAALGLTLPAYIGAMLVAAIIRNLDDATGWLKLSHHFVAELGAVALALFLAIALMTLKLWELADLALPLLTILFAQIVLVALVCWPVFRIMGRDYESAVMTGGFVGFMLGTTANAMAVMRTLAERYGPAPTAFLVAPLVGAFFIDFTNAIIITVFLNLLT